MDGKKPGDRVRELRGTRSQVEFAKELGLSRSYPNSVERNVQQPSREFLKALRDVTGAQADWILYGDGDGPKKRQPAGLHKASRGAGGDPGDAGQLLRSMGASGVPGGAGRFGYAALKSKNAILMHAAKDEGLAGTNLYMYVSEDDLWFTLGDVQGYEFELLREYLDQLGDRTLEAWLEAMRVIRFVVRALSAAAQDVRVQDAATA